MRYKSWFEKRPLIRSRQIDGSLFPNRDRANRIKTKIMKKVFDERKSLAKRFFTSESGQSFLDSLKGHVADLWKYDVKDAAIIIKKIITGLSKNVKSNRAKVLYINQLWLALKGEYSLKIFRT